MGSNIPYAGTARKQKSKDGQGTDPDIPFMVLVEHESDKQDAILA